MLTGFLTTDRTLSVFIEISACYLRLAAKQTDSVAQRR